MKKGYFQVLLFLIVFEFFNFKLTSDAKKVYAAPRIIKKKQVLDLQKHRAVETSENIEKFDGKEVKPIIYDINNYDLNELSVKEKKSKFIELLLPTILIVKEEIGENKRKTEKIKTKLQSGKKIKKSESKFLEEMFSQYRVKDKDLDELLEKMTTPPASIILGQAIIESGWGTSRFFKEANNVFGIWSFKDNEPRIESKSGYRNGKRVYLKKYSSLKECIEDYLYKLAVLKHYSEFRKNVLKTQNYIELTKYLKDYSELKGEYVVRLNKIIAKNNLDSYNTYTLIKK